LSNSHHKKNVRDGARENVEDGAMKEKSGELREHVGDGAKKYVRDGARENIGSSKGNFGGYISETRDGDLDFKDVLENDVILETAFIHHLFHLEFIYKEDPEMEEDYQSTLKSLVGKGILNLTKRGNENVISLVPQAKSQFEFFCGLLWPFIESYWITCLLIFQVKPDGVPITSILERCQWLADNLHKQGKCYSGESISKDTLQNALNFYMTFGVVQQNSGNIYVTEKYKSPQIFAELVLHINRLRKRTVNTVEDIDDIGRIIEKFPILSRL